MTQFIWVHPLKPEKDFKKIPWIGEEEIPLVEDEEILTTEVNLETEIDRRIQGMAGIIPDQGTIITEHLEDRTIQCSVIDRDQEIISRHGHFLAVLPAS